MRYIALFLLVTLIGCSKNVPFESCENSFSDQVEVSSSFLHQKGNKIVDQNDNEVFIKAVNLGSWLHFEAWMFGADLDITDLEKGSESQMISRLIELYGQSAADDFVSEIHDGFITENDFEDIATLGFNTVRLPINHTLLEHQEGWDKLDSVVNWADQHGLYVIIDMHAAPGGQSSSFTADPDNILLWDNTNAQDQLVLYWEQIADRYKNNPTVFAYDLLNEPNPSSPSQLYGLYDRIIDAIRDIDTEHLLLIEGPEFSRDFNSFPYRLDQNMAYSPHVYIWLGSNDAQWTSSFEVLSHCHDVPVVIGEFGEDQLDDIEGLRKGFQNLSGWAVWSWKKVETGGQPGINTINAPNEWLGLMESLVEPAGTPGVMTETQAFNALSDFLQAASTPIRNESYEDALGLN